MRFLKKLFLSFSILIALPHLIEVSFEPISHETIALKDTQSND